MHILLAIAVALISLVASVALAPKPKQVKAEIRELENPTADAGREIPVVFGTVTVADANVLWFGEKTTNSYTVQG